MYIYICVKFFLTRCDVFYSWQQFSHNFKHIIGIVLTSVLNKPQKACSRTGRIRKILMFPSQNRISKS